MTESEFDLKLGKLSGLSDQIDEVKARLKELDAQYDELNYELTQYMVLTGCEGKKLFGKNYILTSRTFVKVEDPVAFEAWVEQENAYKLVMQNSPQKLNAFCKEALSQGLAIPAGVTPGFVKNYVQIRGGSTNAE